MKNKLKGIIDIFLPIYIITNLIYILIGSYLVFNEYIQYPTFSYGYIVLLSINIFIILIQLITKKYKKSKIDIFLFLIIIFAIISTIFAYKPEKALFGSWMRYEGLFTICYYITILYLTSNLKKEDKLLIVYSILTFGFIQCLYSYAQKLNLFNVHTLIRKNLRWATGFTFNRNFFGTLMIISICYSTGLYIEEKNKVKSGLYLILTFLLSIGLLFSRTRSCMLGYVFIMILVLIYAIKNKYVKKYILFFIAITFSTLLIQNLHLTSALIDAKNGINEISKVKVDDNYGNGRIHLYKETLKIVPKYLLHGVGVDCFSNVLDGKPILSKNGYYDKAHNEYLQILVTMGIFSLISYLSLHFIIIKNGFKETIKTHEIFYLLPVLGYLFQAQFNISVIQIAPIFYISLGLLVNRDYNVKNKKTLKDKLFKYLFSNFDNYEVIKKMTKKEKIKSYLKIILKNPKKVFLVLIGKYFIVDYIEIPLTTICTLKCKNCSALMDYYTKGKNGDLDTNIKSIERLLDSVDYVIHLRLLGGEPLSYPYLYDILKYLSDKNKIKRISIVTNGTLIFKDRSVLELLKNNKFCVYISDYGILSIKKDELAKQLKDYNINYYIKDENSMWRDYGNLECRKRKVDELKKQYSKCNINCNSLLNGYLHHCPRSSHGININKIPFREKDCVNLIDNKSIKELRKELYNFYYGEVDYIEACNYCNNGTDAIKEIPPAIQCKK